MSHVTVTEPVTGDKRAPTCVGAEGPRPLDVGQINGSQDLRE